MTIVFICGSLEPGKDGVGDYTRRLAAETMRLGHKAYCLSFCDRYLPDTWQGIQQEQGYPIDTIRISYQCTKEQKNLLAKRWIDEKNPDWLSLQYVPFAFQAKGLPFGLGKQLAVLGKGRQWHIMFHELWIGMNQGASAKDILLGNIQRVLIKRLILRLRPRVIHANTKIYCEQLRRLGFHSDQLPLFSNIPMLENEDDRNDFHANDSAQRMVVFGGIYPNTPIKEFAREVVAYQKEKGRKFSLSILGRSGKEQQLWAIVCEEAGLAVDITGEQSPQQLSQAFMEAAIGIATAPYILSEKSGSLAAMQEHHLRVISVSRPWQPRIKNFFFSADGVFKYIPGNFGLFFEKHQNSVYHYTATEITRIFVDSLQLNKRNS